jgi:hypothetical protein
VRSRARSLLFVQQPVYEGIVRSLGQKADSLRVSADVTAKGTDFITARTPPQSEDFEKLLAQGIQVSQGKASFSFSLFSY